MTKRSSTPEPAATLAAEHKQMLADVQERAKPILSMPADAPWPGDDLHRLLDYLHVEVLRQVVDEEWLVFRKMHDSSDAVALLREEHRRLRESIDDLTVTEREPDCPSVQELQVAVGALCADLDAHLHSEQAHLDHDEAAPSTTALGSQPHTVYALTEGPSIDLDLLPGTQGVDAVLGRLLRLRAGERVELHSGTDPLPLWRRLAMFDPGGYGFSYLERGPNRWRAEVERRPAS